MKKTTIERKLALIQKLDFTQLKSKLRDPEEGKGWTVRQCNEGERLYKQFLSLLVLHPNQDIVPTKAIDDFWHAHILDTRRYHQDCEKIFGVYIHHYPYFGLRGKRDAENLQSCFKSTMCLWVATFGNSPSNFVVASCAGSCRVEH